VIPFLIGVAVGAVMGIFMLALLMAGRGDDDGQEG